MFSGGSSRSAHDRRALVPQAKEADRAASGPFSNLFQIENLETRILLSELTSTFDPPLPKVVRPSDNPALLRDFDRFLPPGHIGRADTAAPDVAEWTKTGAPGEMLVITADQLSKFSGADEGTDTGFVVYGQKRLRQGILTDAVVKRIDGQFASIELDGTLPAHSMYFVWPKNGDGFGDPVAVNRTESWWVGPDRAAAGEKISLFGRNLSHDGGKVDSWIYLKPVGAAAGEWAQVTAVNPYRVDFVIPAGLAPGNYEAWAHNGHGGNYGWAAPVTFAVSGSGSAKWEGRPVYNVKDYGAKGDGVTDDFAAIEKVMALAAKTPRSTIEFPAGTYRLSDGFRDTPPDVRWLGAGKGLTVLKPVDNYGKWALFFDDIGAGTEIRGMTLDALDASPLEIRVLARTGDTHDVRFTDVAFYGPDAELNLKLTYSHRVFIENSDVLGRGIHVSNASQVFIDNVKFYGTGDAGQLIWADGGNHISITNSEARDFDNSNPDSGYGWAQGRFYVGQGIGQSQTNVYLAGNKTTNMGVRPGVPDQNSGEQYLWELNLTQLTTRPTSASARTVQFAGLTKLQGDRVTIVGGRGVGQYRKIVNFDRRTGTITLDRPWNVTPDTESMISVGYLSDHVVVYENVMDGKGEQVAPEAHTFSAGVVMFSANVDFVVDSNTMTDVRFGIYNWMIEHGTEHMSFYSNTFARNSISHTREAFSIHVAGIGQGATAYHGNVYRNNYAEHIVSYGIYLRTNGHGTDGNMNVFQGNSFRSTPVGLRIQRDRGEIDNTIFENNRFVRHAAAFLNSYGTILSAIREGHIRKRNAFEGFMEIEALWGDPSAID